MKVLQSICQQIWKIQQGPQHQKSSVFISIPKKGNAKECSNYHIIALISQASKVMLIMLIMKIAQRNINNLRYAEDITLMTENEEELRSLLKKVNEKSEKTGLKLNIKKTIMASGPTTLWQIGEETMETVRDYFLGLQNHCRW